MSYSINACPKCAKMNQPENKFCGYCGNEIHVETICPKCKTNRKKKGYGDGFINSSIIGLESAPGIIFGEGAGITFGEAHKPSSDYLRFCTNCGYDYES